MHHALQEVMYIGLIPVSYTHLDVYKRQNELGRELGITQQTFYRWRRKFGGMEVSDAQELNRLLDENRR